MDQATKLKHTGDPVAEPAIRKVIHASWKRGHKTWVRAGLELEDLYQMVREKFLRIPEETFQGKGLGYSIKVVQHYLSDRLKHYRTDKFQIEGKLRRTLNDELRRSRDCGGHGKIILDQGFDERAVQEEVNSYLLSHQKLSGMGFRTKRIDGLKLVYDIRHSRKGKKCYVNNRWMILDPAENDRGYQRVLSLRLLLLTKLRRALHQMEEALPVALAFEGDPRWLDEIVIPKRHMDSTR